NNASFAKSYVKTQLSEQHVVFTAKDKLTAEEAQSPCIVANAGKALTTGKQAECYANHYIGLHVQAIANGKTYADLGGPLFALQAQIAATKANDPALPNLQKQLATITAQRETLFHGETLRGLLLTSYGFSEMGAKAGQAGTVAFAGAGVLALLALAGLVHGVMTPATEAFAPAERKPRARRAPAVVEA
ncbi:MAG TPA: hypothetical protein VHD87_17400, partial [Acidimicrobiales bacterium]|nr:hypothetical protein [Acidimicrobiales bacterium]